MNWLIEFITNPYVITSMSSWAIAQVLKTILHGVLSGDWTIERLFGDGGMPSGHSATVASMATFTALMKGTGSFEFAIATMFAIIVCHDAMGVRLETGKQAQILNEIMNTLDMFKTEKWDEIKLKEFVGHSPVQVCAGVLVGILNALLMYFAVFN